MNPLTRLISKIKGNRRKLVRSKDVFPLTGVAGEAAKCNQQLLHCLLSLQMPGGRRLHSPLHSKCLAVCVPETFAQQPWSILTEAYHGTRREPKFFSETTFSGLARESASKELAAEPNSLSSRWKESTSYYKLSSDL